MTILGKAFRVIISITLFSCSRQSVPAPLYLTPKISVEVIWNIDFQAGFLNDTVSLTVNDMIIFENILITSESTSVYTGVKITCYKGENNRIPKFLHIFTLNINKVIDYNVPESDNLDFEVIIKAPSGLVSAQKVNVEKAVGKYIGISKSQGEAVVLYIIQNSQPFLYY